ncbi:MAG: hypothetical protein QG616_12 [Pseudomonadota bacterium]|jgi:hypothetical protein|nr:hypothetical protein [Pseudomonadota bacterium]
MFYQGSLPLLNQELGSVSESLYPANDLIAQMILGCQ